MIKESGVQDATTEYQEGEVEAGEAVYACVNNCLAVANEVGCEPRRSETIQSKLQNIRENLDTHREKKEIKEGERTKTKRRWEKGEEGEHRATKVFECLAG